jgi:3-isopropylmalate/(R)-2-methylmalate dehydratase small subunit
MSFEKFNVRISESKVLPFENIDTDQIIPARFLKTTTREGFGLNLFYDWRYNSDGSENGSFRLNDGRNDAIFLVAGKNFGCGSSREHAAWALYDYGFRAVISSFFADIFRNNALNNGLLPVQVSDVFLKKITDLCSENPGTKLKIDLPLRRITIEQTGEWEEFPVNSYKQNCLINGFDDIDYLVSKREKISEYEKQNNK